MFPYYHPSFLLLRWQAKTNPCILRSSAKITALNVLRHSQPLPYPIGTQAGCPKKIQGRFKFWRMERDSNPRYLAVYLISSQAPSTTRTSIHETFIIAHSAVFVRFSLRHPQYFYRSASRRFCKKSCKIFRQAASFTPAVTTG